MASIQDRRFDLNAAPFVAFYEVTRACDLVCRHCRACAQAEPDPYELPTQTARALLRDLARFDKKPLLVLTGGDPLKRSDVFDLVKHGVELGLEVAMTPSATPLVTRVALGKLRSQGLSRLAVSLDGADADSHDGMRGVAGSFARTLDIMCDACALGLPLQVNTTITAANVEQVDAMADVLARYEVVLWSVFFLVPVGRGIELARIAPEQYESVFARLWQHARSKSFAIKTTEAPHYRRYLLQRHADPQRRSGLPHGERQRAPLGINDGKGVVFIDHAGEICPSGFLPISCGEFPRDSVVDVYQNSELFRRLRDPDRLQGKCGACEFRRVCGGSRARAYAITGNPLAAEPDCCYVPAGFETIPASA